MAVTTSAVDDLMSVLGHELRSPLTAIRGAASLLLMAQGELAPAKVAELLRLIDSQAGVMSDRVEDVLVAARLDSGDLRLMEDEVDLGDVVADVLEAARARAGDRRVRAPGVVEDVLVRGDQQRVTQVLRALVTNAVAFSPPGAPVELRVRTDPTGARVEVRDRGQGIPPTDRRRIFERGLRLDSGGPGAGLGLYIARGLVGAMGGEIGVEPRTGGGSVFWFTLAAAK
jgi:two-component system, OmpR family, sensor kinase